MDLEQLNKRVDWLDDERRKDKLAIATLEERLASMEANISPLGQQIKELSAEMTRLGAMLTRFDQIETNLLQLRVESARSLEAVEKARIERERETEKNRRSEVEILIPHHRGGSQGPRSHSRPQKEHPGAPRRGLSPGPFDRRTGSQDRRKPAL